MLPAATPEARSATSRGQTLPHGRAASWLPLALALLGLLGAGLASRSSLLDRSRGGPLTATASGWLESLSEQQRTRAHLEYDDTRRVEWHFIPMPTRRGLPLMDMDPQQQAWALRLLEGALSQVGYQKTTTIMSLELLLRTLEGPGSEERRNPDKYYLTVFGTPGPDQQWGFGFEGHHLSLNFVLQGDKIVGSSPQFFGANPAHLRRTITGEGLDDRFPDGLQPLAAEEQLAFELLASFDEQQRRQAIVAEQSPPDVRWAGQAQVEAPEPTGLSVASMSADQQAKLRELIHVYTDSLPESVAAQRWAAIDAAGWESLHFNWSGPDQRGVGHAYCIQGPTFIVELVNNQPDAEGNLANHIHCVWRSLEGDFQPLSQHP
jgi:hypothetical protein